MLWFMLDSGTCYMLWFMFCTCLFFFAVSGLNRIELAINFAHPPTLHHTCRNHAGRTWSSNWLDGGGGVRLPPSSLAGVFYVQDNLREPFAFLDQHLLDVCMPKPTVCSPCFTEKRKVTCLS